MARRRSQQGMPRIQLPSGGEPKTGRPRRIIIDSTDIDRDTIDILLGKKDGSDD